MHPKDECCKLIATKSTYLFFLISLSNDLDNKEVHGDARAAFQIPTLCQHLFTVTGRADAPLLRQAVGEGKRAVAQVAGVTTELTALGSSKTRPD